MDLSASMPAELVREIYGWVRLFQQRDSVDRVLAFQETYRLEWDPIMADVRMNVPRYTFVLTTAGSSKALRVSVYAPDCQPELWPGIRQKVTVIRRVKSIHAEFMQEQELMQGPNPRAIPLLQQWLPDSQAPSEGLPQTISPAVLDS